MRWRPEGQWILQWASKDLEESPIIKKGWSPRQTDLSAVYQCTWWTTPGLFWPSGKVSELCTGWWAERTSAGRTTRDGPGGCCQHLRESRRYIVDLSKQKKACADLQERLHDAPYNYLVDAEQPGCPASSGHRRSPHLTASVAEGSWWLHHSVSPPCQQTPGDQTNKTSRLIGLKHDIQMVPHMETLSGLTLFVWPFCVYSTPMARLPSKRILVVMQRTSAFRLARGNAGLR